MVYDNMVDVRILLNNCFDNDLLTTAGRHTIFDMTNCISEVLYDFCFSHIEMYQYGDSDCLKGKLLEVVNCV